MADPIVSNSYGTSILGNLTGNGNSNQSAAANSVFQYGQYQPYTVNNPMGTTSFANGTANSSLSPLQSQIQGLFGGQIVNNAGGSASTYNPNTSFLPQQYQSIFGNMQGNVNSQYNALQQAQQPFTQQYLQSNLDNEQSKGTLASTAGAYQTAGAQTAANAQSNANYAQAQNYALNTANSQFGAASSTAGLGEQQSEFGPQFAQSQTQGAFSDLLNQNQLSAQITGLGGSLGAQQSSANTTALLPSVQAAQTQDQTQSGLMNSLLFGNGSGGLLNSLLGTSGSGSSGALGAAGSGISSLLKGILGGGSSGSGQLPMIDGSGAAIYGSAADTGNLGSNPIGAPTLSTQDPGSLDYSGGLTDQDLNDLIGSFSSAGGQAANSSGGFQPIDMSGVPSADSLDYSTGAINLGGADPNGSTASASLGDIGSGIGIAGDLASGTSTGYANAALSGASLAAKNNLLGSGSSGIGGAANTGLSALGLYQGIEAGGVSGDLEAAASAAKLASVAGSTTGLLSSGASGALSSAAGYIAAPLSLYNFAKTYQSGATGTDALGGAEAGASVGSIFGPIGTLVGGVIGGAVGAVSSAFGGGKPDQETQTNQAIDSAQASGAMAGQPAASSFQYLAGIMDAKNNTAGHSEPIEQVFGRMGEGNLVTQMAQTINSAYSSGQITKGMTPSQIYSSVVSPWLTSKGAPISTSSEDEKGNNEGQNLQASLVNLISQYTGGQLTSSTSVGVAGQAISNLPKYAGLS